MGDKKQASHYQRQVSLIGSESSSSARNRLFPREGQQGPETILDSQTIDRAFDTFFE